MAYSTNTQYLQKNKSSSTSARDEYYWKLNASVSGSSITYSCYVKGYDTSLYGTYYHYIDSIYLYKNGSNAATLKSSRSTIGYRSSSGGSYNSQSFTTGSATLSFQQGDTLTLKINSSINDGSTFSKSFDIIIDAYQASNYSWKSLGSGTASSVSYNLSAKQVGYYLYTPSSAGTLTIYTSSSYDTYGGIGVNGNLSLTSDSSAYGSNVVSGYIARDDDSGTDTNFQVSGVSLSANTTYRIYVHQYSGEAASGTLYMSFTAGQPKYTTSFNANGGSGAPASITCNQGDSITIPTTKPTRSGYIFLGWVISTSAAWPDARAGQSYTPNATRTLYALWGYTLTVNPNGGTMISGSDSSNAITTTSPYSTIAFTKTSYYGRWLGNFAGSRYLYTATGNYNQPIRTGYTFNGWTVTSGNGSVKYNAPGENFYSFYYNDNYNSIAHSGDNYGYYYYINNETTPTHSTVTAQWIANSYTVTFDPNGGGTPSQTTKTVTYDQLYGTLPTVSRAGYTFNGWFTAASGGYQIASNNIVTIAGNHTLYAQWTLSTATLTLTKGTGISGVTIDGAAVTSKTITIGNSVTINATLNPGYHWKNWTSGTSTTQVSANQSYTFNMPSSATTYKANGEANTYTIVYNANDGVGTMASSTHTYGISKALNKNTYTRLGYTFVGWSTSPTATTATYIDQQNVSNLTTSNGATINLYAVWEYFSNMYIYSNGAWHKALKYVYTTFSTASTQLYDDYSGNEYEGSITYVIGQTWADWCNSKYNTPGLYCSGGQVYGPNGTALYEMSTAKAVLSTDTINSNGYEFV